LHKKEIDSFSTSDIPMALKALERGGASLYFGSPVLFREKYCKKLACQLGMDFTAYFPDFSSMSECEVFVSTKGGITDFHTDFQENFSIQLQGSKKWKLCKSGVEHPLSGFTPHYANSGNLEQQLKMLNLDQPFQYDRDEIVRWADEVQIDAGDILYHPAGIWHAVECVEDSITINISLKNLNVADIISSSLKHLMNSSPALRQNVTFSSPSDFNSLISESLEEASSLLKSLTPEQIAPQNMFMPRYLKYDFGNQQQIDVICQKLKSKITQNSKISFNPLSIMIKCADIPQDEISEEVDFRIHHNYAGNNDYESSMTVDIVANEESYELLENLSLLRTDNPSCVLNQKDLDWNKEKKLLQFIKVLVYQGFLVVTNE
jgi:hypothetical protein